MARDGIHFFLMLGIDRFKETLLLVKAACRDLVVIRRTIGIGRRAIDVLQILLLFFFAQLSSSATFGQHQLKIAALFRAGRHRRLAGQKWASAFIGHEPQIRRITANAQRGPSRA